MDTGREHVTFEGKEVKLKHGPRLHSKRPKVWIGLDWVGYTRDDQ